VLLKVCHQANLEKLSFHYFVQILVDCVVNGYSDLAFDDEFDQEESLLLLPLLVIESKPLRLHLYVTKSWALKRSKSL